MCGVAGIVDFGGTADRSVLERMTRAITHRGPDDEGFFVDGQVGLGFRRLSIIDLSGGHQPMRSGPATVVFNGEIYNYRELRAQLHELGHEFHTSSDTEVLLAAYRQWGEGFVEHLDGMFAFGLWNAQTQTLLLGRDRFGKKPLYWAQVGSTVLFASELKSLVQHPKCPRTIDRRALRRYLAFEYVPTPDCIFEGVHKVREAHLLRFVAGAGPVERRYWQLPESTHGLEAVRQALDPREVDDACERVRLLLGAAVKRRLVADVPVGVFLSGGIDSTAVAALARREAGTVRTFSIAFDEGAFDESPYARRAAKALGTEHHEERLSPQACLDLVPRAADQLDEPFADPSYFPTFLLSRFARTQVTVALGGDGADELFAGYDPFVAHPFARAWGLMPAPLQQFARRAAARLPTGTGYMALDFKVKSFLAGASSPARYRHQTWLSAFPPERQQALLQPGWAPQGDWATDVWGPIDELAPSGDEQGLDRALRYYIATYLKDDILTKVDRASMAASLEVRAPFLDTALASEVARLPAWLKLRGLQRKWLLKRALQGVVPDEVLHRKKHGFAIPVTGWLKGPLKGLLTDVLAPGPMQQAGIFEPAEVQRLLSEHFDGAADHRKPLWTLMMFELWRRKWGVAHVS